MFKDDNRSIMIVKSGKKEAPYAQMLFQLMSKIPNYEASQPITEEEYEKSFLTIDNIPKGKVIFFGNGKEVALQKKAVNWKYDCFGMKYGWMADRCVVTADPKAVSSGNIADFTEYYNSRIAFYKNMIDFTRLEINSESIDNEVLWKETDDSIDKAVKTFTLATCWPLYVFGKSIEGIETLIGRSEIWQRQYELLVCEFILNGLREFTDNLHDKIYKDQIIVVYDLKDAEYAHMLHNLIQQYSDYDAVEFPEKLFIDNAKFLSSKNKIIFLGKTKTSKEHWLDIHRHVFHEHGMRFGWFGNHAFIYANKLAVNQRDGFIEYYSKKAKQYEDKAAHYAKRNESNIGKNVGLATSMAGFSRRLPLPALVLDTGVRYGIGVLTDIVINSVANTFEDLSWYQYQLLLREFIFNGLSKFMED